MKINIDLIVNVSSSGNNFGYVCALFCVLMEILILLEAVFVLGFIPIAQPPPRGSSTHTLRLINGIAVSQMELDFPGRSGSVFQAVLDVSRDKAVVTLF